MAWRTQSRAWAFSLSTVHLDHPRIEQMLFDGALTPVYGALQPDLSRPGLGLTFKHADAARYAV